MNERYLFRGKRKDNGEWVTGYLIQGNNTYIVTPEAIYYMVVSISYMASVEFVEVIPETVGQYTGAKLGEQNLFDGDLLSYIGETYEIVWDEHFLVWSVKNKKGDMCFSLATILRDKKRECKLIASKWDNPGLLEVSK